MFQKALRSCFEKDKYVNLKGPKEEISEALEIWFGKA